MIEIKEVDYRGEKYRVGVTIFVDENGEKWTTTESDQEWWENLRSQYVSRHPEALESFKDYILKETDGRWEATSTSGAIGIGKTSEEAIFNLYIQLAV